MIDFNNAESIANLADEAISTLLSKVSQAGSQLSTLQNRYDMLNDLVQTYQTSSNEQAFTKGGSSSSLLNQLL